MAGTPQVDWGTGAMPRVNAAAAGKPQNVKLWQAAQQFQAGFLTQLVRSLRECHVETELFADSAARETYDGMLSEAIADRMSEADAMHMTEALYRRLGGRFLEKPDAARSR